MPPVLSCRSSPSWGSRVSFLCMQRKTVGAFLLLPSTGLLYVFGLSLLFLGDFLTSPVPCLLTEIAFPFLGDFLTSQISSLLLLHRECISRHKLHAFRLGKLQSSKMYVCTHNFLLHSFFSSPAFMGLRFHYGANLLALLSVHECALLRPVHL